jgi:hypothetical protein
VTGDTQTKGTNRGPDIYSQQIFCKSIKGIPQGGVFTINGADTTQ